jgi:hypothetical protein
MFPQGTVLDGLSNVAVAGPVTRIQFPRPGAVSPPTSRSGKENVGHVTTLGFAYVNDVGRAAFRQEPFVFPAGSIIARERLLTPSSNPNQLVVMIKHERDFNPKADGWEFLTLNGAMTRIVKREKEGNCLKCHAAAANNDFVFPEDARQR